MRGTERNGNLLQERSEHGVRRQKGYQDLGTVYFRVGAGIARRMNGIKPYDSTSNPNLRICGRIVLGRWSHRYMPRNPSLQHVEDKATDDAVPQPSIIQGGEAK